MKTNKERYSTTDEIISAALREYNACTLGYYSIGEWIDIVKRRYSKWIYCATLDTINGSGIYLIIKGQLLALNGAKSAIK